MAIFLAAVTGLLAALLATKGKKGIAIFLSIISAVSLFIAFPDILQPDFINLGQTGNIIAGLIGVIVALSAVAAKKMPTAFLYIGILVAMWALCRLVPTVPPAFAELAPELGKAGEIAWDASVKFVKDIFEGVPTS